MRHIVAFSGGYDSTYLLTRMCQDSAFNNDEIWAVSLIQNLTGEAKLAREHASRIIVLEKLRERFPDCNLKSTEIVIDVPWFLTGTRRARYGCPQPVLWLNNILPILGDDDKIYLSYIRGDDALCLVHEMEQIWSYGKKVTGSQAELIFPIRFTTKEQVLQELIKDYPDILPYCTSCEGINYSGRGTACGECVPCQHLRGALATILANPHVELGVRIKAQQMLKEKFKVDIRLEDIDNYNEKYSAEVQADHPQEEIIEAETAPESDSEEPSMQVPVEVANDLCSAEKKED